MLGSRRTRGVVALAILALSILAVWAEGAAAYAPFPIEATASYEWTGKLEVVEHVTGSMRKETEPWVPCGGTPPGLTLQYRPPLYPGDQGGYSLVDSEGALVAVCAGAPEILFPIPRNLSLLIGRNCKRYTEGETVSLEPSVTETAATPGTSFSEEVSFDRTRRHAVSPGEAPPSLVCLASRGSYTTPNQECAEFFDADLCADETHGYRTILGTTHFRLVRTRTARCPSAKRARVSLGRQLKRLLRLRTKSRRARRKLRRLSHRFEYRVYPRYVGECR